MSVTSLFASDVHANCRGDEHLPGLQFLKNLPSVIYTTSFPKDVLSELDPVAIYHNANELYWQFDSSTESSESGWTVWDAMGLACIFPSGCSTSGLTVKVNAVLGVASSIRPSKHSKDRPHEERQCPQEVHDLLINHGISVTAEPMPDEEVRADEERDTGSSEGQVTEQHTKDPESSLAASMRRMTTQVSLPLCAHVLTSPHIPFQTCYFTLQPTVMSRV